MVVMETPYTSHWSLAVTGKLLSTSRVSSRYTHQNSLHNIAMCADLLWLLWSVTNILYLNKPCDEAMGAAQGSQGQTDLGEPSKLKNSK